MVSRTDICASGLKMSKNRHMWPLSVYSPGILTDQIWLKESLVLDSWGQGLTHEHGKYQYMGSKWQNIRFSKNAKIFKKCQNFSKNVQDREFEPCFQGN